MCSAAVYRRMYVCTWTERRKDDIASTLEPVTLASRASSGTCSGCWEASRGSASLGAAAASRSILVLRARSRTPMGGDSAMTSCLLLLLAVTASLSLLCSSTSTSNNFIYNTCSYALQNKVVVVVLVVVVAESISERYTLRLTAPCYFTDNAEQVSKKCNSLTLCPFWFLAVGVCGARCRARGLVCAGPPPP